MKFIHTADIHLGMEPDKGYPWSEARTRENYAGFVRLIDKCREDEPELLLIAGDLFHRQPLAREMKDMDALFASIPNTRVVIIAGNHDYISSVSRYNGHEWPSNVTFFMNEELESVYFEDLNVEVYGLSYCHRQIHAPLLKGVSPQNPEHINILMVHGGDQTNLPINRNEIAVSGFNYVACGHLHMPIDVCPTMRYCGDLEPLDKNDVGPRGYIEGNIDSEGNVTSTFVACSVRQYFKPAIRVDQSTTQIGLELEAAKIIAENGKDNIYTFFITGRRDPEIRFDATALMQKGNVLDVIDETVPDYDMEKLKEENKTNLLGEFIESIERGGVDDEIKKKALEYGILALLKQD